MQKLFKKATQNKNEMKDFFKEQQTLLEKAKKDNIFVTRSPEFHNKLVSISPLKHNKLHLLGNRHEPLSN